MSGNLLPPRDGPPSGPACQPGSVREREALIAPLRAAASELELVWGGIAPAVDSGGFSNLVRWIESGYAGQMHYFANRLEAYRHPRGVLDGVRSIIVFGIPYAAPPAQPGVAAEGQPSREAPGRARLSLGRIARYARDGTDYHDVIHPKLKQLCRLVTETVPGSRARGIVDTAPLMEREVAELAGFGWQGKNTLLLNKQLGSYFLLACLLTDLELPIDAPHASAHCGTCTACLEACPTAAFPQPGVLDASRCISYLTIEHRGPIPTELRPGIGAWLFGCDVCQEVCPWNRKPARAAAGDSAEPETVELYELFELSEDQFRARFRATPLWRPRRRGMLRNAAIVLGNHMHDGHLPALEKGLWDKEPIVRGASAWAIGQSTTDSAQQLLRARFSEETDAAVREEIRAALMDR